MNIYETFKRLGWKARVRELRALEASFGGVSFMGGCRTDGKSRTRRQVIAAAERDLANGDASWLEKDGKGFYRRWGALKDAKFSSPAEMALRLAAMGACG